MKIKSLLFFLSVFSFSLFAENQLPDITAPQVHEKIQEIMKSHATHKELTPELIKRILTNYLEELDPSKTYFIESDIQQWSDPSDDMVNKILTQMQAGDYSAFDKMQDALVKAIQKRHSLDKQIADAHLPKNVKAEEFKDLKWTKTEKELLTRLLRIRALQIDTAAKLNHQDKEKALSYINKRQKLFEDEMLEENPALKEKRILTNVLKATASALDTHTAYFTPEEATQFIISVQQRLFGIGVQLRDDVNGFSVVKIIEGGPAANSKELKLKDRIIAVDGEPVVGLGIMDAVKLIRGEKDSAVVLTIVRENRKDNGSSDETLNIKIPRGEVVLKETRYESNIEPFGDGAIGYLRLFSFYQDPDSSSAGDLAKAIEEMKSKAHLKGLIFDLRYNSGGLLSQAVDVAGLFISKGVVVSIKDENGEVQHLRHLDDHVVWDGPLIVLINRSSASAAEIVAGTLKDYGRALIVGDDHSYGKGSFQTFTLNVTNDSKMNPQGEYKVTRGRYYTVSGSTPQLTGVTSDIVVPGALSELDIGEKFSKYPLANDMIKPSFDDDLSDVPYAQRNTIRLLYKFNMQPKLTTYQFYLPTLIHNSQIRIENNKPYQEFIKELKKKDEEEIDYEVAPEDTMEESIAKSDLQLIEARNIMKDYLFLKLEKKVDPKPNQNALIHLEKSN